jgi:2-polyprenyl-3-methyl-5-hydroxy-6-metoxy-1,4-benzoquinol methylase
LPQSFIADAIVQAARTLPQYPRLEVLDLSCGRGELLSRLAREGCSVRGSHYRADDYKLVETHSPLFTEGLTIDPNVDLTQPLPYPSASRDVVLLSEVVEHLPDWIPVVREAARILRPCGHLLLTTPNVQRLHSRLRFFLTGTHKLIRRRVGWDLAPADLYAYHINPVDFPLLHTVLHQAGLHIAQLRLTRFKWEHAWLLVFYPLICVATWWEMRREVENDRQREGVRDLRHWMLRPAMLTSEQLLLVARKS